MPYFWVSRMAASCVNNCSFFQSTFNSIISFSGFIKNSTSLSKSNHISHLDESTLKLLDSSHDFSKASRLKGICLSCFGFSCLFFN
ncbi:TPA: hypothetical protein DEG21_01070 [Patescibacteria group bacterium]|nr:hypothetical protein [Candidatus Gracilibacteria bacterium]HBY74497.1 hypothetical protein [Candidatus Gracilibacteria bacterium]